MTECSANRPVLFIANAARWFDKVNGNTYHSVRIIRCSDGKTIVCPFQYGYGDQYRQTSLLAMAEAGWITGDPWDFERLNNYPIHWSVSDGRKRDCVANGRE